MCDISCLQEVPGATGRPRTKTEGSLHLAVVTMALSSRLLPGHLPTPASLLLLVPLLLGVSPVQISRLTAAARDGGEARYEGGDGGEARYEGGDGGEARYDGGARPVPAWPHPYWDIPGEYCK